MSRERLPERRNGETLEFDLRTLRYTANLGKYEDGRIGEVFLRSGKAGTDTAIACQETAICLSFALQYGGTVEQISAALPRHPDGTAQGAMGTLFDILAEGKA